MPLTRRSLLQFGLLLLCVPAQYYLSELYSDSSSEVRTQAIFNLFEELKEWKDSWFSFQSWKNDYMEFVEWIVRGFMKFPVGSDESVAIEVLQYREKFGRKKAKGQDHNHRPESVLYKVGQVVGDLRMGYKGVIIGWKLDKKDNSPVYTILLDEGESNESLDPVESHQDNLYIIDSSMVKNRKIRHYFYSFDGTHYIPKPWLREKYPAD